MTETNRISLLDCTLRDGGYVNDWKFGQDNIVSIFERVVDSGAEIIEIGFLDDRRPFDIDRSIMPKTECAEKILGKCDKKQAMVVGMIDFGTCAIENLQPAKDSYLDGIRVIFKQGKMVPALEYCRQVKALGYKVFAQLVSVTTYTDEDFLELLKIVNDVKPYALSMVDTYGLLHPAQLLHISEVLDKNLDPEIGLGFHAHNNFQLAYANAEAFIDRKTDRHIVVDGTLHGMGKSAGNATSELVAMTLNDRYGKHYSIDSMLESIKESIMPIYEQSPWGYKIFFYTCAKNHCHPNYVTYFQNKHNLSSTKIDELLSKIEPEDKKLLYDVKIADALYEEYLKNEGNDENSKEAFKKEIAGKKVLVIGPGKNISLQKKKVDKFISKETTYIISINYIPENYDVDCIFTTNVKRYHEMTLPLMEEKNKNVKILATSNIECLNGTFDFSVNRAPLLETEEKITDNSFLMFVKLLKEIGAKEVYCAGFDGYSDKEDNYCNPDMEYQYIKKESNHLNEHMKEKIAELRNDMDIHFITYSVYDAVEDINGAAI